MEIRREHCPRSRRARSADEPSDSGSIPCPLLPPAVRGAAGNGRGPLSLAVFGPAVDAGHWRWGIVDRSLWAIIADSALRTSFGGARFVEEAPSADRRRPALSRAAPPLGSAPRRLGARLARSGGPSLARRARTWPRARLRRPRTDPACYLCPGNAVPAASATRRTRGPFVFTNDFYGVAGRRTSEGTWEGGDGHLRAVGEPGRAVSSATRRARPRPRRMDRPAGRAVVDAGPTSRRAGRNWRVGPGLREPGRGDGRVEPHPARPDLAGAVAPPSTRREDATSGATGRTGRRSSTDRALRQSRQGPRSSERTDAVARHRPVLGGLAVRDALFRAAAARLPTCDRPQRDDLGRVPGPPLRRYDGLFGVPFPLFDGLARGAVRSGAAGDAGRRVQSTATSSPPLLRSATVRKFMVGYELLRPPSATCSPRRRRAPAGGRPA
jgi:UDPglucose--hexose-1-phosphate uridylyltransferase